MWAVILRAPSVKLPGATPKNFKNPVVLGVLSRFRGDLERLVVAAAGMTGINRQILYETKTEFLSGAEELQ